MAKVAPFQQKSVAMDLADIYTDTFPALNEDGEFVGFIDSSGTTLQAMCFADDDEYWFEVPRPDLGGSYAAVLSFDDAIDLLKLLDGPFPIEGFDGFKFESWQG